MNRIGEPGSTTKVLVIPKSLNQITLTIFAPLLMLVGVAGFLTHERSDARCQMSDVGRCRMSDVRSFQISGSSSDVDLVLKSTIEIRHLRSDI
jgi:hypothetical protein